MKKRIFCALTAVCMLLSMMQMAVFATDTVTASGTCGDNLTWTVDELGTLTITGEGPMMDVETVSGAPWWNDHWETVKTVIIGDGVTSISNYAFYYFSSLTSVTIGDDVTSIGKHAFYGCDKLAQLDLGDSVVTIGNYAFSECVNLTQVTIPDSTVTIGDAAFSYCTKLEELTVGKNVTHIADHAFYSCIGLTSLALPDGLISIGSSAFSFCTGLTEVILPDSVTTIGISAFDQCSGLTKVVLSKSLTQIPSSAFFICSGLKEIVIPASVTSIGRNAFALCSTLESVEFEGNLTSIGGAAFLGCEALTGISLPEGIESLDTSTFERCTSLKEVTIPASMTTIHMGAFVECGAVETVHYNGTKAQWEKISIEKDNEALLNATIVCYGSHFTDVPASRYYFNAVNWAVENEITSGTGDGTTFSPDDPCTRGQVVTFLWRAAGKPEPTSTENPFSDLESNKYYYKAVLWAVEKGITSGYKDGSFQPDRTCSRAEIVTFLYRYAEKPPVTDTDVSYSDVNTAAYYYNPVLWANENSVVFGYSDGTFRPGDTCTRGQIAAFLYRYLGDES